MSDTEKRGRDALDDLYREDTGSRLDPDKVRARIQSLTERLENARWAKRTWREQAETASARLAEAEGREPLYVIVQRFGAGCYFVGIESESGESVSVPWETNEHPHAPGYQRIGPIRTPPPERDEGRVTAGMVRRVLEAATLESPSFHDDMRFPPAFCVDVADRLTAALPHLTRPSEPEGEPLEVSADLRRLARRAIRAVREREAEGVNVKEWADTLIEDAFRTPDAGEDAPETGDEDDVERDVNDGEGDRCGSVRHVGSVRGDDPGGGVEGNSPVSGPVPEGGERPHIIDRLQPACEYLRQMHMPFYAQVVEDAAATIEALETDRDWRAAKESGAVPEPTADPTTKTTLTDAGLVDAAAVEGEDQKNRPLFDDIQTLAELLWGVDGAREAIAAEDNRTRSLILGAVNEITRLHAEMERLREGLKKVKEHSHSRPADLWLIADRALDPQPQEESDGN